MTDTEKLFQDYAQACYPHLNIKPKPQPTQKPTNHMRSFLALIFCAATAMVGYTIHGSIFWSIVDFIFSPVAIVKWLICHELTASVLRETFGFILN